MTAFSYKIMGKYKNLEEEELDIAKTEEEAEYLRKEYVMAFDSDWRIWIMK